MVVNIDLNFEVNTPEYQFNEVFTVQSLPLNAVMEFPNSIYSKLHHWFYNIIKPMATQYIH
jgi:hypothetical protein